MEVIACTSQLIKDLLEKARLNSKAELIRFLEQELNGYSDRYPEYRNLPVSYFDTGGQLVTNIESQYCLYPLAYGVDRIENHLKNGMALKLPTEVIEFLTLTSGNAIAGAHISPQNLHKLLIKISEQAKLRFEIEMES